MGGGAVAPASGVASARDEPSADATEPSDRGARPDPRAGEPESGAGAPAHDEPDDPSPTADPEPGGSTGSGNGSPAEPSPSPAKSLSSASPFLPRTRHHDHPTYCERRFGNDLNGQVVQDIATAGIGVIKIEEAH